MLELRLGSKHSCTGPSRYVWLGKIDDIAKAGVAHPRLAHAAVALDLSPAGRRATCRVGSIYDVPSTYGRAEELKSLIEAFRDRSSSAWPTLSSTSAASRRTRAASTTAPPRTGQPMTSSCSTSASTAGAWALGFAGQGLLHGHRHDVRRERQAGRALRRGHDMELAELPQRRQAAEAGDQPGPGLPIA
ncbi:hypothetical protein GUJ93_ZPchr0010g8025 [Zizania palustris]|uniref:Uncharacterized protein n=1 Tax=Zizania palustris TaxID=103762 RepID=A0A8J5WB31_ZIZPA|nr:hypothetical protein GUJ93_ZPchr0010g8025 [Zizania palustris]